MMEKSRWYNPPPPLKSEHGQALWILKQIPAPNTLSMGRRAPPGIGQPMPLHGESQCGRAPGSSAFPWELQGMLLPRESHSSAPSAPPA